VAAARNQNQYVIAATIDRDSGRVQTLLRSFEEFFVREFNMRRWLRHATVAFIALVSLIPAASAENAKAHRSAILHRMVIQVDQNDPTVMNLALNNATNVIEYYRAKGEDIDVDVVAYGPGLHMFRADTSPVQDRIKNLKNYAFPSRIQFSACNVTKAGMEKKEGHPIDVLSDVVMVPSGVVRLMELQEKGWSYIRP
jgi:intracellular sulfur oxidation DsrE/DsrF family protein